MQMKKIISITITSLATLIILLSATLAHHHHQEWVHLVMDTCNMTNCDLDQSITHCHDLPDHSDFDKDCVFEKDYVSACSYDIKFGGLEKQIFHNPFLLYCINDNQLKKFNEAEKKLIYKQYKLPYIPTYVASSVGLRAPPTSLLSSLI